MLTTALTNINSCLINVTLFGSLNIHSHLLFFFMDLLHTLLLSSERLGEVNADILYQSHKLAVIS